jgi:hypothetical protein
MGKTIRLIRFDEVFSPPWQVDVRRDCIVPPGLRHPSCQHAGRNSLLRQSYALHQVLKTRIGAQGVELWLDSKLEHGI